MHSGNGSINRPASFHKISPPRTILSSIKICILESQSHNQRVSIFSSVTINTLVSLLHPRACIRLFGVLKSFRLSYSNDMTPTFIGTQQQPWSLWHTNTSVTPCHQGCFPSYRVSKGLLPKGLP